jgi:integrase
VNIQVSRDPKRYHGEPTWDNLGKWYLAEMVGRKVTRHTVEKFTQSFRIFRSRFEDSVVTPAGLNAWIDEMRSSGYKDSTIEKIYMVMKGMFSWAKRNGILDYSPFSECRPGLRVQIPDTYITIEDYNALKIEAAKHEHGADYLFAIECAWDTGARISDVCLMRWEHINWQDRYVSFVQHKLRHQGEKARLVLPLIDDQPWTIQLCSMTPKAEGFIRPWLASQYRASLISCGMRALFDRAGVVGKSFHDFRRAKYSSLAATKFRLEGCSKVMGSRDPAMFYRYTKSNPDMLRTIRTEANQLQNQRTQYAEARPQEERYQLQLGAAAAADSARRDPASVHPADAIAIPGNE